MESICNRRVRVPRFILHTAYINILRFYGRPSNHYVFLRPQNLHLTIATTYPKNVALIFVFFFFSEQLALFWAGRFRLPRSDVSLF